MHENVQTCIERCYFRVVKFQDDMLVTQSKLKMNDPLATWEPYGESKLANICHIEELARLKPKIGFFSLHPGVVQTELARDWAASRPIFFWFAKPFLSLLMKTPQHGAQTSIFCALSDELENPTSSGKYFSEDGGKWVVTGTKFVTDALAKTLWQVSEEITESKLPL